MKASLIATLLVVTATPLMADDEAPMTAPVQRITMETAQTIARAAIDACRKQGISAGVTVVDRNGIAPGDDDGGGRTPHSGRRQHAWGRWR